MAIPVGAWIVALDLAPRALELVDKIRSGLGTKSDAAADEKLDQLQTVIETLQAQLHAESARASALAQQREFNVLKLAGLVVVVGLIAYSAGFITGSFFPAAR